MLPTQQTCECRRKMASEAHGRQPKARIRAKFLRAFRDVLSPSWRSYAVTDVSALTLRRGNADLRCRRASWQREETPHTHPKEVASEQLGRHARLQSDPKGFLEEDVPHKKGRDDNEAIRGANLEPDRAAEVSLHIQTEIEKQDVRRVGK